MAQLIVELYVPLVPAADIWAAYPFPWIAAVEAVLADEVEQGAAEVYDFSTGFGESYVFFLTGCCEERVLSLAARAAAVPGLPGGVFALVTDDEAEEMGTGRRVDLPELQAMSHAAPDHWTEGEVDRWLEGGVAGDSGGYADEGFLPEVDRIFDLLDRDDDWRAWWVTHSKAPLLELAICVERAERSDPEAQESGERIKNQLYGPTELRRGRQRHRIRLDIDVATLAALEPDERRVRALPAVLQGLERVRVALKARPLPPLPAAAQPAPLSPGVLRRRRLRELLQARRTS